MRKIKFKALIVIIGMLTSSCFLNHNVKSREEGYYKILPLKATKLADPVIFGNVYDELGAPFNGALILNDDKKYESADAYGKFLFKLSVGIHKLRAKNISYKFVTIYNLPVALGDSIQIDFYLEQDTSIVLDE
jgi:hypothetical protein